jgi:hypothetical protein
MFFMKTHILVCSSALASAVFFDLLCLWLASVLYRSLVVESSIVLIGGLSSFGLQPR